MKKSRESLLIGVLISLFVTTLVGGGITAYLQKSNARMGVRAGVLVGTLTGLIHGGFYILYSYYTTVKPYMEMEPHEGGPVTMSTNEALPSLITLILILATVFLIFDVILGLIGGALGGYVADPQNTNDRR